MENTHLVEPTYSFVGGNLSIDFTNTVNARWSGELRDKFTSFRDLAAWAHQSGLLAESNYSKLLEKAECEPNGAEVALRDAVAIRELIYRVFAASTGDRVPDPSDLAEFNERLAQALQHARVASTGEGFVWTWEESEAFDSFLWPIVRSAADLLTSSDLHRVKSCGSDTCGWLFVDTSRNGSRRWCDMSDCGNRAKARRHYNRVKKGNVD